MHSRALIPLAVVAGIAATPAFPAERTAARAAPAAPVWTATTSLPAPRASAAIAVGHDGLIYVFGGLTTGPGHGVTTNTTFILNPRTGTWSQGTTMPAPLEGAAAVTLPDGRIAVMGGSTVACSPQSCGPIQRTVEVYTPLTHAWRRVASMHSPRYRFAATLGPDGRIYAIGGFDGRAATASAEAYDSRTDVWQDVTPLPQAEQGAAATVTRGRIVVIGGSDGGAGIYNDVFVYDGHAWNSGSPMPTERVDFGIVTTTTGSVLAIGGYRTNQFLSSVQAYDPWSDTWSTVAPLPHAVSDEGAVRLANGLVYAIGGYTGIAASSQIAVYGPRRNPFTS